MTRKTITIALAITLSSAFVQAQMKPSSKKAGGQSPLVVKGANKGDPTSFPRISQNDAMKLHREGKAIFVDVRSNEQFSIGHIKGARNIPGSQVLRRFSEIPPGATVITYCACSAEQSSGRAAAELVNHGVKNVWALKGGWADWKTNRYPLAAGPK